MKIKLTTAVLAAFVAATPALAEGDAAAGQREFRACGACHQVTDADGNNIEGRGRTAPNLYNVVGRVAGAEADFDRYSDGMKAAGEKGLVWDAETLAAYIAAPKDFISEYIDDSGFRSQMPNQRVRNMDDLIAFLAANSPDAPAE